MLASLFPKSAERYSSLPLFGPVVDEFDDWLLEQGYTHSSRRSTLIPTVAHMDQRLRRRGIECIDDLTPLALQRCWRALQRHSPAAAGTVHVMERFLRVRGLLNSPIPKDSSPTSLQLAAYSEYLREVRGFVPSTVHRHLLTAREFLAYKEFDKARKALAMLNASDLEGFVRKASRGVNRGRLQHKVSELRSFLRFLAASGRVAPGLENQIDTPRVYRQEKTPTSLALGDSSRFPSSDPADKPDGPPRLCHVLPHCHLRTARQ